MASIAAAPAQVGRIHEGAPRWVQLGHECVAATAGCRLEAAYVYGEVRRAGVARDVGGAGRIHGDSEALVVAAPAKVGRVREHAQRGDLGHEDVVGATVGGLEVA